LRKIRQILIILINNANKFTHHGSITLSVEPKNAGQQEDVQFAVKDTGIGIDPENHQRIFEQFVQVDDTFTRQYGGVGLGLTIARHLCGLIGGEIRVESKLGSGATFFVTLPLELRKADSEPQRMNGQVKNY